MSLETIFLEVVNTSLLVSMIACVIMIIRIVFKRVIPKAGLYVLWSIVLIRLVIPISISSPMSLLNAMPQTESVSSVENDNFSKVTIIPSIKPTTTPEITPDIEPEINHPEGVKPEIEMDSTTQGVDEGVVTQPDIEQTKQPIAYIKVLSYVWLGGTGLLLTGLLTWYGITYFRLRQAVRVSEFETLNECRAVVGIKKEIPVYVSDLFTTPVVFGLIRPKIIVPHTLDLEKTESLVHMLTHELVHIKRFDYLTKLLSQMLLCVHWFNPLMWLSYRVYEGDMESSCDESVLRMSADDIRGDYATSLLNLASQQQNRGMRSSFVAFGESNLKKRVKGIMGYKNRTVFSAVIAILLIGLVGCSLLTNPVEDTTNQPIPDKETGQEVEDETKEPVTDSSSTSDELTIGDSVVVSNEDGKKLKIKLMGYEIVEDAINPDKQGIVFFFDRVHLSDGLLTVTQSGSIVAQESEMDMVVDTLGLYQDKVIKQITDSTSDEERVTYPNYKNVVACDGYQGLYTLESNVCYQMYPYEGEGEYSISQQTVIGEETYENFVVNVPTQSELQSAYTDKYSKEDSIYSVSDYQRQDFETKPYLSESDEVKIFEDEKELGTVSLEGYEVIQSTTTGAKGVVFFFNETNTGTRTLELGLQAPDRLTLPHVFYEDIYLDSVNYLAAPWQSVDNIDYGDTKTCQYNAKLQPGESRMCYQYYSYIEDGNYLINIPTKQDADLIELSGWKSYLINVEE